MRTACWAAALAALAVCASQALAEITISRDGDTLTKIEVTTGAGQSKLEILPKLWANTNMFAEDGKMFRAIDPFFYGTQVFVEGRNVGGYHSKPEVFATWKAEAVKDAKRPGVDILSVVSQPAGYEIKKEVTAAFEPGQNVVYVFNRVTALKDVAVADDRQCFYVDKPVENARIVIDGQEIALEATKAFDAEQYMCAYMPRLDQTFAVVFLPRALQAYPGSDKAPLGRVQIYVTEKQNGADFVWGKAKRPMTAGESITERYVLFWGQGDQRAKVAELAKKAQAGEFDAKVVEPGK